MSDTQSATWGAWDLTNIDTDNDVRKIFETQDNEVSGTPFTVFAAWEGGELQIQVNCGSLRQGICVGLDADQAHGLVKAIRAQLELVSGSDLDLGPGHPDDADEL